MINDSNDFEWYSLPFRKIPCLDSFAYLDHLIINLITSELEEMESLSRSFSFFSYLGETESQRRDLTWAYLIVVSAVRTRTQVFSPEFPRM